MSSVPLAPRNSFAYVATIAEAVADGKKVGKRGLQGVLINAADYAAGRDFCPASSAARFHGSSSSMRLTGWSAIRESTSRR